MSWNEWNDRIAEEKRKYWEAKSLPMVRCHGCGERLREGVCCTSTMLIDSKPFYREGEKLFVAEGQTYKSDKRGQRIAIKTGG